MSSIQEKLQLVFPQSFQVKRIKKEIQQILDSKQKYNYEPRMSFTRGQSVTFMINFTKGAFKKYKKLQNEKNFEIKILLKRQYPATHPLIYCMSDTMINFGLQPFRDYSEFLTVDWSAKFTIMDIIKLFPEFLDGWNVGTQTRKGQYRRNEFFEIERVFSWSFLQTFPVKFVHPNKITGENPGFNTYISKDLVKITDLVSIFKSRKSSTEILLEIKNEKSRESLIFRSEDSENIVNCILDYMKLANSFGNEQEKQESSEEEDKQDIDQDISKESPTKANIEEIKEEIVLYESMVQTKMTAQNVSNLVALLKKAIEFYSAIGSSEFQIYLKKMKSIMGNQMAQVLLESTKESQEGNTPKKEQNNKIAFQSIIDII